MRDYLKPGTFFLTQIAPPTGTLVAVGQALAGAPSRWSHAGMVIDQGRTVEAMPHGAIIGSTARLLDKPSVISDGPIQMQLAKVPVPNRDMWERNLRAQVVATALDLVGTPYSFLDFVALAAEHLHLPSKWVRHRVQTSQHLICSALVDRVYDNSGIHLFDDGRLPGDVMPSDLDAWNDKWESDQLSQ